VLLRYSIGARKMVNFKKNVTTEYWDEGLFDCEATREGARMMDELARRYQGLHLREDQEPISIQDSEDEYPIEVIGSGQTRVVIYMPDEWYTGTGDCIAKIQWDPHHRQNSREIDIWDNANGRMAGLLAPILDWSEMDQWLIMPEAETYRSLNAKEAGDIVRSLESKLKDMGVRTTDIRRGNIGRIEGRDVVIDYGSMKPEQW